jgi:integrase
MKGHLTRRGQRSWRLKYDLAPGDSGKRQTRYATLRGTRAEAQAQAAKILAAVAEGTHTDPSRETVAEFVKRWLTTWASDNISRSTWVTYDHLLRKHLVARVGARPIQKLRPADLQAVYSAMAAEGLADRTCRHVHRVVHRLLGHAVRWNVIPRNPAGSIDAPRVRGKEMEVLAAGELQAILETLRGKELYPIAAVALATGLRRGEVLALRWADVNLEAGFLQVERALEETSRSGITFKTPKTRYGRRQVTLPASTVALLRDHHRTQLEQRLLFGRGKEPADALVFSNFDGSPRSPHWVTETWRRVAKHAGIRATFHSLRHTHASTLIASGLDVLTISRRLGHGSPVITLSVYGHLFKTDDRAALIIEKALKGGEG